MTTIEVMESVSGILVIVSIFAVLLMNVKLSKEIKRLRGENESLFNENDSLEMQLEAAEYKCAEAKELVAKCHSLMINKEEK